MVHKGSTTKKSASRKSLKTSSSRSHSHASHHTTKSNGFKMFAHCIVCRCKVNINNCKYVMVKGKGSKMRTRIEGVCEKGHKFAQFAKSSGGKSSSKTMKGGAGNGPDHDGIMPIIDMSKNQILNAIEPTINFATVCLKFEINNEQQPEEGQPDPTQDAYTVLFHVVPTSFFLISQKVKYIITKAVNDKADGIVHNNIVNNFTHAVCNIFMENNNVNLDILRERIAIFFGHLKIMLVISSLIIIIIIIIII